MFCCTIDLFMKALVVGSCIVDVFLYLEESPNIMLANNDLTFHLGDKIPLSHTSFEVGGNGANVAVALKSLGVETSFYTFLASDVLSTHLRTKIQERGVTIVSPDSNAEKSPVSLILNLPQDRVILSYHPEFHHEFLFSEQDNSFETMYLTSISAEWENAYKQALQFASSNSVPIAFSPGSKQMEQITDTFKETLHATKYLFINKSEAQKIISAFNHNSDSIEEILQILLSLGPEIVSVTDGGNGAYAKASNSSAFFLPPFGEAGNEKTGAGDSYAAAFLAGILNKEDLQDCMRWGALNAHFVMRIPGAQNGLLNIDEIRTLSDENESFQAKELNQ